MLTIRAARPTDHAMLEDLQRRASLANDADREWILAHSDAIALPREHINDERVVVAERDGIVLGFCVTLPSTDGDAELDGLFVEPNAWRTGIGAGLVNESASLAALDGAIALHVFANPAAESFYSACGFTFVSTQQTRFGVARTMRRPLVTS